MLQAKGTPKTLKGGEKVHWPGTPESKERKWINCLFVFTSYIPDLEPKKLATGKWQWVQTLKKKKKKKSLTRSPRTGTTEQTQTLVWPATTDRAVAPPPPTPQRQRKSLDFHSREAATWYGNLVCGCSESGCTHRLLGTPAVHRPAAWKPLVAAATRSLRKKVKSTTPNSSVQLTFFFPWGDFCWR